MCVFFSIQAWKYKEEKNQSGVIGDAIHPMFVDEHEQQLDAEGSPLPNSISITSKL